MADTARPSTLRETASSIIRFWSGIWAEAGPCQEASQPNFSLARFIPEAMGSQNGEMPFVMIAIVIFLPAVVPAGGGRPPRGGGGRRRSPAFFVAGGRGQGGRSSAVAQGGQPRRAC